MLQKCTIYNVAGIFFDEPETEFSLAEIKRRSGKAATSVLLHLKELAKEGIIVKTSRKAGKRQYPVYKSNQNSISYRHYKQIFNFNIIKRSGIIDFLKDQCFPECIILFGSYARGEDIKTSDIDLYMQSKEKKILLQKYEKLLGRKIQLHFKEDFNRYPKELKNNIINGIILSGYLEAFK